jgi:two-component system, NarL family, sensor kinase
MFTNKEEAFYSIILSSLFAFVLILVIVITAVLYFNRRKRFWQEKKTLEIQFERNLLQSQLEIQEQTFRAISQEIHDNVGQTLSLAKVQVNIIDQSEGTDKALLAEVRQNIGKALNDLRDLAKSLNSDHVQSVPLKDLISAELSRMQRSKIIETVINEEGAPQSLEHQKKLILFRAVQESLQNILKHAAASRVTVSVRHSLDTMEIKITDDGKGFELDKLDKTNGLGLRNITNRVALLGGKAEINSFPSEGTVVTLRISYA